MRGTSVINLSDVRPLHFYGVNVTVKARYYTASEEMGEGLKEGPREEAE
jgi:hypothetical protein